MLSFEYSSLIDAPVSEVFAFHERPDALEQLTPPWAPVEVVSRSGGIREGAKVVLVVPMGPIRKLWVAHHTRYEKNRIFVDLQKEGPFRFWLHRHEFEAEGEQTRLTDRIHFSLPGAPLTDWLGGWVAKWQLRRMFEFRHQVTRRACEEQTSHPSPTHPGR